MNVSDMFVSKHDTDTHRVCGCCGERKPVSEFYKDGKNSKGLPKYRRDCKECYKSTRLSEANFKKGRDAK